MTDLAERPTALPDPPEVSGDDGGTGHLEELRADPIGLMERTRAECDEPPHIGQAGETSQIAFAHRRDFSGNRQDSRPVGGPLFRRRHHIAR